MPVVGECEGGLTLHFRVMADLLLVVTLGGRGLPGGSGGTMKLAEEVHTHTHMAGLVSFLLAHHSYSVRTITAFSLHWVLAGNHTTQTQHGTAVTADRGQRVTLDGSDSRQGTKGDIGRQ